MFTITRPETVYAFDFVFSSRINSTIQRQRRTRILQRDREKRHQFDADPVI